jgi:1,4-dihydroxy-2-naphthoate octaprenyltransferase
VFLFALSISPQRDWVNTALAFIAIHLFLYPASNGYNSFYDKDEKSIGGLENPPPVTKELLYVSWWFDGIALLIGLWINLYFAGALLLYGLVSKAYSYEGIRLKKRPIIGWLTVGVFQGGFTFLMCYLAINKVIPAQLLDERIMLGAILSTILLLGSYPMTQVYQHEEDAKRGDITISLLLGIKGTFLFTMIIFMIAAIGFSIYYYDYYGNIALIGFHIALLPVLVYFVSWFVQVNKDLKKANFRNTMRLNMLSSVCLIIFYSIFIITTQILSKQ